MILAILFYLFNFPYITDGGHEKTCKGIVIDKNHHALPFAIIETDHSDGLVCDSSGRFSFRYNPDSLQYIVVQRRGYEDRKLLTKDLGDDSITVELDRENIKLNEVTIVGTKKRIKEGVLGKRKLSNNGSAYMSYGDELAIYLENKHQHRNQYLKCIYIYITDEGLPATKFKVHVYGSDSATGNPLNELSKKEIIVHGTKGNEWLKVDVHEQAIPVKDGIFVSVEWTGGYGNDTRDIDIEHPTTYWDGGAGFRRYPEHHTINGAVLALTWKYGIRPLTYQRSKSGNKNQWHCVNMPTPGTKMVHGINPMIYCKYSFTR